MRRRRRPVLDIIAEKPLYRSRAAIQPSMALTRKMGCRLAAAARTSSAGTASLEPAAAAIASASIPAPVETAIIRIGFILLPARSDERGNEIGQPVLERAAGGHRQQADRQHQPAPALITHLRAIRSCEG
jgi:hypothetical protein